MNPYQTYLHTLAQDAEYHSYNSATTALPLAVQTFANLLCDAFRLPEWVARGPYPRIDSRSEVLLQELQRSPLPISGSDQGGGSDTLRTIFNLVLNDCTSLRHVLSIDRAYSRRTPLESFLCLIVRNILCTTRPHLRVDEDSALALPRYSSGEQSLLFHHMELNIRAPLLVSVSVEVPLNSPALVPREVHDVDNVDQDDGVAVVSDDVLKTSCESLGEDVSSSHGSKNGTYSDTSREDTVPVDAPPKWVPLTVSEWLDLPAENAANEDPDDDEDAHEDQRSLDELDLHVLEYSPNRPLPAMAMLPIVCMGDEATLPILMMSALYQRWTWRIGEPIIGVSFRRYDSEITFHLGWTDSQCEVGRILPRVHIARMDHIPCIDMADPVHALSVAQFMLRIDDYIRAVQNSASSTIFTDLRRWRVDSSIAVEPSCSDDREQVTKWLRDVEGATLPKLCNAVSESSVPFSSTKRGCDRDAGQPAGIQQGSELQSSVTAVSPTGKDRPEAQVSEGSDSQGVQGPKEPQSCSHFLSGSPDTALSQTMSWLFDRKAIPVSLLSDSDMYSIHIDTAEFFWPEEWESQMPTVDDNVQEFFEELQAQVKTHLNRCDGRRYRITRGGNLSANELNQVMRLLGSKITSILQACKQARAKAQSPLYISEAGWRHDLDRLLFDFLSNLPEQGMQAQPINRGGVPPANDSRTTTCLLSSSLERAIHLPRSMVADISDLSIDNGMYMFELSRILSNKVGAVDGKLLTDLGWEIASWRERRGRMLSAIAQWDAPDPDKTLYETVLDRAAVSPLTGVCDALGAVVIPLPVDEGTLTPYCFVDPIGLPTAERSTTLPTFALPTISEETQGHSNDGKGNGQGNSRSTPPQSTSSSRDNVSLPDASDISLHQFHYDFPEQVTLAESVGELTLQESGGPCSWLELPLLVAVYQKRDTDRIKTQNQHRLYSTAAARFLETIGITRQPVFGVMSDGSVEMLTTTWVDGEYVHIFEEHIESFDISTAFGAWHYVTVLARIAVKYGPKLVEQFKLKQEDFIKRLNEQTPEMRWRQSHQNDDKH